MFLLGFLLFTSFIALPVMLSLWRRSIIRRDTHDSAADFYHSQLDSLKEDHAAHLLDDQHYEAAQWEVQRRLLDSTASPPEANLSNGRAHTIIAMSSLLLIPILALLLYSLNGLPMLSSQSASDRTPPPTPTQSSAAILEQLNTQLASLSPHDPTYVSQHIRRGQLEEQMGLSDQTVLDWKAALDASFTPELALQIAELETSNAGHVTPDALALYHRALDASPVNAPWRLAVEERIAAGEHDKDQTTP